MVFSLGEILKVIGPSASIVFAAWIFMGFLQQRYDSAVQRYMAMAEQVRQGHLQPNRGDTIRNQVKAYRRRCELMTWASNSGLISAMLLILTLLCGEMGVLFPTAQLFGLVGMLAVSLGLTLVIVSAALVIWEGVMAHRQIEAEISDLPDM